MAVSLPSVIIVYFQHLSFTSFSIEIVELGSLKHVCKMIRFVKNTVSDAEAHIFSQIFKGSHMRRYIFELGYDIFNLCHDTCPLVDR